VKDIAGYEGQYAITKDGRVWSHKRQSFLRTQTMKTGYLRVGLRDTNDGQARKMFLVHRLVALTYIENQEKKLEVNHLNGTRYDNRVENLEWATRSENNLHAWRYGAKKIVITPKYLEAVKKNAVIARAVRMTKFAERKQYAA
jgi:hypothetical protein